MQSASSIFWHDYETFGANPKVDRPAQFAGIRTDMSLNPIGEPITLYCQPADDYLPNPEACLITGITPQFAMQEGVPEFEFISRIHAAFAKPGTCVAGYNSIRFDDEVTRYTLFRNLFDPYAREWQNGNTRWDLIDLVRLVYVLKPSALQWPTREDGAPSFRLEELTRVNGIEHGHAHDAMSDVYATIALAKRIRQVCPDLFDFVFEHRQKQKIQALLSEHSGKPLLHVSSRFSALEGACALVYVVARHPENANGSIVFDLRQNPALLRDLTVEQLAERLFTSQERLGDGVERVRLKTLHANKCPVVVPTAWMAGLDAAHLERLNLNGEQLRAHLRTIKSMAGLEEKIQAIFKLSEPFPAEPDPEFSLYSGGFLSPVDKRLTESVRAQLERKEAPEAVAFEDSRLEELLFRLKGRSFSSLLVDEEFERWEVHRRERLYGAHTNGLLNIQSYFERLQMLMQSPTLKEKERFVLEELKYYGESLIPY